MNFSKFASFSPKIIITNQRTFSAKTPADLVRMIMKEIRPEHKPKPDRQGCRKRKPAADPDLSHIDGKAFKTCGSAFVVQKDALPPPPADVITDEDLILRRIEADPTLKGNLVDPMPPFRSVEQRLIDLTERKLHPFYKVFMSMPKKKTIGTGDVTGKKADDYKTHSGPILAEEIPEKLKIKKELLEKKNIFADFKRVQLPRQMVARIVEMERNRKPTLEKKATTKKCSLGDDDK